MIITMDLNDLTLKAKENPLYKKLKAELALAGCVLDIEAFDQYENGWPILMENITFTLYLYTRADWIEEMISIDKVDMEGINEARALFEPLLRNRRHHLNDVGS